MGKANPTGWGGRREGAGRKSDVEEPRRVTFDLDGTAYADLARISEQRGESISRLLRAAVRQYTNRAARKRG